MIRRVVSLVLGVAITAAVAWWLLTPEVVGELRIVAARAEWPMLGGAMLLGAAVQWLRAWRFAIMTTGRLRLPGRRIVRIAFQLNFLNFVLPFRLGELSYPVLMRHATGQPMLSAAGVLLLARIFDLCTVGAILAATAAALRIVPPPVLLWAVAGALAAAPAALVLGAHALAARLVDRMGAHRLAATLEAARWALGARQAQFAAIGLSFFIWLVFGGLALLAANAVTDMSAPVALLGASAGNLAFALPVNGIGGLGASQAAWVAAVSQAGVPWEDAVISAIALYAVTLAAALLFGGAAMIASSERPRRA